MIKSCLERWSPDDLTNEFVRPTPNEAGERPRRSRQWIVWHVVEHDVHHGGEISFSLGMHGALRAAWASPPALRSTSPASREDTAST